MLLDGPPLRVRKAPVAAPDARGVAECRDVNILFVCIQNAGRSQIAEALFRREAAGRHDARSAGSSPASHVHVHVAEAMRELGIEVADRRPRRLDRSDAEWADVIVTMGCGDACPYVPGKRYVDWELEDPHGGSIERVREIRDEIGRRVAKLVDELDESPRRSVA